MHGREQVLVSIALGINLAALVVMLVWFAGVEQNKEVEATECDCSLLQMEWRELAARLQQVAGDAVDRSEKMERRWKSCLSADAMNMNTITRNCQHKLMRCTKGAKTKHEGIGGNDK